MLGGYPETGGDGTADSTDAYKKEGFHFNAQLPASLLECYCSLTREGEAKMQDVMCGSSLTARSYHRMLKVARTIADLEGCRQIQGAASGRGDTVSGSGWNDVA
mgnify:CR=1 FL=1